MFYLVRVSLRCEARGYLFPLVFIERGENSLFWEYIIIDLRSKKQYTFVHGYVDPPSVEKLREFSFE